MCKEDKWEDSKPTSCRVGKVALGLVFIAGTWWQFYWFVVANFSFNMARIYCPNINKQRPVQNPTQFLSRPRRPPKKICIRPSQGCCSFSSLFPTLAFLCFIIFILLFPFCLLRAPQECWPPNLNSIRPFTFGLFDIHRPTISHHKDLSLRSPLHIMSIYSHSYFVFFCVL